MIALTDKPTPRLYPLAVAAVDSQSSAFPPLSPEDAVIGAVIGNGLFGPVSGNIGKSQVARQHEQYRPLNIDETKHLRRSYGR